VGDVEACVDLFCCSPFDLVHLTFVSSTSFSVAQVVAAQEAVVAEEAAVEAVAMEVVSSVKPSEVF
jgi:hypothetical protein